MADSVWSCKKEFGSACKGLPADNEHEGKEYCVLHFPSVDKNLAGFKEAIEKKLKDKDFDFRGVYFPGVKAFLATFEEEADFSEATFEGEANFFGATFKQRAHFNSTIFKQKAHFNSATFEERAHFNSATFEGVADFTLATFK